MRLDDDREITVIVKGGTKQEEYYTFSKSFRMGREKSCEVCLSDPVVSAFHVEILREDKGWRLHDLHSTNGTYLDGHLISKTTLDDRSTIQLGRRGPLISFRISQYDDKLSLSHSSLMRTIIRARQAGTETLQQFFRPDLQQQAGQFTIQLHHAVQALLKKRSRKLQGLLWLACAIAIAALGAAWYKHEQVAKIRPFGVEIFYTMKALELQINGLVDILSKSNDPEMVNEMAALTQQHAQLQSDYDKYVQQLGTYASHVEPEEQLILKVARAFGECDINAPPDFVSEVKRYIRKWQASDRMEESVRRCKTFGYAKDISQAFLDQNLPAEFLYVALQESGFDRKVCGPRTKYGIAKGMWQFIPGIARAYGLRIGPLSTYARHDPKDERHDFQKSTKAAARLVHDLYTTKAQGSGLLVLASYNWGIGNLRGVIDKLPNNPRDRNFWNLIKNHKIPKQTYDFVFYVVSAAVIGEDPGLFGFGFSSLLEDVS